MFHCTFKISRRAAFVMLINRYTKRLQCSKFISTEILEADSNLKKKYELENIKLKELWDNSQPKPLEEIPLCSDSSETDFHPAEFIDDMGPPLPVSFNLAAYVNHSESLIKLVNLGVDLSEFDKNPEKAKCILKLNFEKHMKQHIQFLHDHGVKSEDLGRYITKNPFIFNEDVNNLQIRINYLQSKKFSSDAIARIITSNPYVLSMSTVTVDKRLGYFQKQFYLSGDEVRYLFTKSPKLISYEHEKCLEKIFIFKEVFGFTNEEAKKILLTNPKVWMLGSKMLKGTFDVVHNSMGISQERILEFPGIFQKRTFIIKERHEYLVHLNRAQYDPTQPNYVSLCDIATTIDSVFCERCAHTSIEKYNEFLKSR